MPESKSQYDVDLPLQRRREHIDAELTRLRSRQSEKTNNYPPKGSVDAAKGHDFLRGLSNRLMSWIRREEPAQRSQRRYLLIGISVLLTAPIWVPILFAFIVYGFHFVELVIGIAAGQESGGRDWSALTSESTQKLVEGWRNIGLIALGIVGLYLAIWRSILAQMQTQTAIDQRDISENGLQVDRFQKGAQMLASERETVQLAGVFALRELAVSRPDDHYLTVQSLLCSFVRENTQHRKIRNRNADDKVHKPKNANPRPPRSVSIEVLEYEPAPVVVAEALATFNTLRTKVPIAKIIENEFEWQPDFTGANLSGMQFILYNFSNAVFDGANLTGSQFGESNLISAHFARADLSNVLAFDANLRWASFRNSTLYRTSFQGANLFGASFIHCDATGASFLTSKMRHSFFNSVNFTGAILIGRTIKFMRDFHESWAWADDPPHEYMEGGSLPVSLYDPGDNDKNVRFYGELVAQFRHHSRPEAEFRIVEPE